MKLKYVVIVVMSIFVAGVGCSSPYETSKDWVQERYKEHIDKLKSHILSPEQQKLDALRAVEPAGWRKGLLQYVLYRTNLLPQSCAYIGHHRASSLGQEIGNQVAWKNSIRPENVTFLRFANNAPHLGVTAGPYVWISEATAQDQVNADYVARQKGIVAHELGHVGKNDSLNTPWLSRDEYCRMIETSADINCMTLGKKDLFKYAQEGLGNQSEFMHDLLRKPMGYLGKRDFLNLVQKIEDTESEIGRNKLEVALERADKDLHTIDAELYKLSKGVLQHDYATFKEYQESIPQSPLSKSLEDIHAHKMEVQLAQLRDLQFKDALLQKIIDPTWYGQQIHKNEREDQDRIRRSIVQMNKYLTEQAYINGLMYVPDDKKERYLFPLKANHLQAQNELIECLQSSILLNGHQVNLDWVQNEINDAKLKSDVDREKYLQEIKASYEEQKELHS